MTVVEVANGLVALVRQGQFEEAAKTYYSPNILSVEAMGEDREARGIEAIAAKGEWWEANNETHGVEVSEPYIHGDQFAVVMKFDITPKATGKRGMMEEVAVYTVQDGKITEERFFYGPSMMG
jgi:hypothetical protein